MNDTAYAALRQENAVLRERIAEMERENTRLYLKRDLAQDKPAPDTMTWAEQALIESEARAHALIEISPGAILFTSLDGIITDCNQQAAHLFGYRSVDDLCGKSSAELIAGDYEASASLSHSSPIACTAQLRDAHYTMCRNDGSRFPAAVSRSVITDLHGTPIGCILSVRDISMQKQAEQALTDAYNHLAELNEHLIRSRNLLQALFDGLEDGLLLLDSIGGVQMVNRALAALLGSTPHKLVGQNWSTIYPRLAPDFPDHLALNPPVDGHGSYRHTRYRNLDGATRILNVQTITLRDQDQAVTHVIVHVADVTETVQLQAQVIENERFAASGRLAASVAHEINTPLQSIQTALGLIRVASEEDRTTYVGYALEETQRVARIVRQLLDLYRPGGATPGPVEVNALIERLLLLIGKRLRDQRVAVERELSPNMPPLLGRSDELMQVVLNLMVNAIEAMPDGGTLRIRTTFRNPGSRTREQEPGNAMKDAPFPRLLFPTPHSTLLVPHIVITIADTGYGISPQLQARIFEPFVTTKENGTGLGLSICTQIVRQHKGTILVESQPGEGSTFTVVLPLRASSEETTNPS